MQPQEYVKQGIDGVSQLSDTNMTNGINNTNAGLIQVVVVILILFFLVVIIRLMKSIDKFSDAMENTNIIMTKNVANVNEIKSNIQNHADKTDKSFSNIHNRINEMSGDLKVVKSNTDACLKRSVL